MKIVILVFLILAMNFTSSNGFAQINAPTVAEAEEFMKKTEAKLADLNVKVQRASWVQENFITDDTQAMAADAIDENTAATTKLVEKAKRFEGLQLSPELERKFLLLKLSLTAPAPNDSALRREMTEIGVSLDADYGKGKYCRKNGECLDITAIEKVMSTSRNPEELKELWTGWHAIAPPMRQRYARFVDLSNRGAREIGFKDTGALWRAGYDMTPEEFSADLDRLWNQVKPLYMSLHTYVRWKLAEKYGPNVVPPDGPLPAHLLGNPWAQEWGNVYDLLGVQEDKGGVNVTELLRKKNLDPKGMVKYGEGFFTSMGFPPLPPTFWERSLFTKPADRDVVCHASAWDIDNFDDLRVKMCIQVRGEDFVTIHHELGHNFYQRAYKDQPFMFKNGANDGFHEAIGDAIALAITPEYLHKVGLLESTPQVGNDIPELLKQALDRVAFLPFGLMIDQWRWKVFSGEITPANYNKGWWDLRLKYQGVTPPVARSEADFDPGAKYHVAANVPYTRYFLAHILEFQFYRALCRESGYKGPLNRCTFYGSKEAGAKFNKMLAMGQSKPWPDALEVLTGERQVDGGALLEYFAPLKQWLDEQNRGKKAGW
jgi:peptidyl-dipeptidase A